MTKIILYIILFTMSLNARLSEQDSTLSNDVIIGVIEDNINTNPKRSEEFSYYLIQKRNSDRLAVYTAYKTLVGIYYRNENFNRVIDISLQAKKYFEKLDEKVYAVYFTNAIASTYQLIGDYSKATEYYLIANDVLKDDPDQTYYPIILRNIILLYHRKGNEDSAEIFQRQLHNYYKSIDEESQFAKIYSMLSNNYLSKGNYKKALNYALQELETYRANGDQLIDEFYGRLASIYSKLNNPQFALKYYFKALSIATEKNDPFAIARYQTNIGSAYTDKNELDSALFFYESALNITESKVNSENLNESLKFKRKLSLLLNNIAVIYLQKEDYLQALDYGIKAINVEEDLVRTNEVLPYLTLIEVYLKLDQLDNASNLVQKILSKDFTLSIEQRLRALKLSSELNERNGNYKNSLAIYKDYMDLKDSINQSNSENALQKLQVEYNTEILEKQTEIKEKETRYTLITSIIVLTALFAIALLMYFKFKEKKKAEKELSEKNQLITKNHKELERLYQDLQSQERTLFELNNSKDKFFSIIAHDLKNPLHNLFLISEIIYTYYERYSKDQLVTNLKTMHESAKAASNLLQNLLTWARSQSGNLDFNPVDINVYFLLAETIELLNVTARNKKIDLINEVTEEIYVNADANMVDTVFRNLISNALKFTPENGEIKVKNYDDIHFWKFEISDTGTGIKKEDQEKLFRIDVHHTTKGTEGESGTGLGLILCKEFVEMNGGEIGVESEFGKGTTFYFTLPKAYPVIEEKKKDQLSG